MGKPREISNAEQVKHIALEKKIKIDHRFVAFKKLKKRIKIL